VHTELQWALVPRGKGRRPVSSEAAGFEDLVGTAVRWWRTDTARGIVSAMGTFCYIYWIFCPPFIMGSSVMYAYIKYLFKMYIT